MLKKLKEWIYYPAAKPYKASYVRPFVWVAVFFLLVFGLVMWYYGEQERLGTEGLDVSWATGLEISWKQIDLPPEQLERIKVLIMAAEHQSSAPSSGGSVSGGTTFVLTGGGQSRKFNLSHGTLRFAYPEGELAHSFAVSSELEGMIGKLFAESFNDK